MTYLIVAMIRQDPWIRDRVAACAATEGVSAPEQWTMEHAWQFAAQPGWAAAWESALAVHPEDDYLPGKDEAVVTDAMILAAVQSLTT